MKREFARKSFPFLLSITFVSFMVFLVFNQKDIFVYKGQVDKTVLISIGHKQVKAFVVDNQVTRERGLGGRESISPDEAMLFVWRMPAQYGIWMKDMKFPIDIFWLQETRIDADAETQMFADKDTRISADKRHNLVVVDIKEQILPSSYPGIFIPNAPAKYVLETESGFAKKNGVKIGDQISF